MNRFGFILKAKTQYSIQSPFLFDLYSNVVAPRLDRRFASTHGIDSRDRYAQILFKISDHYRATDISLGEWSLDDLLRTPDGNCIGLVRQPHSNKIREAEWSHLVADPRVTLSVDLFHTGLIFTSSKLSKQHWLLR